MRKYEIEQIKDRRRFLSDTQNHRMEIIQDDGPFRHIKMRKPGTSDYHFNITTTPGYLIFTGDMGSYVFSRLRDMFEFHRIKWDRETPLIDYQYWAGKLEAVDRRSGSEEFDADHFKQSALRAFWNHDWPDPDTRRQEWTFHIRDLISAGYQTSDEAISAMLAYEDTSWTLGGTESPFSEFYDYGPFTKPSLHFRWACWAIAETIRNYDLGGDRFTRQAKADANVYLPELGCAA